MYIVALLLAIASFVCFIVEALQPAQPRRIALVPLGLALFVAAFVFEFVFLGIHPYLHAN